MAKYLVKVSYGGAVNATAGETVNYTNKSVINDLLRAGYIEEVKAGDKKPASTSEPSKADKPKTANKRTTKKDNKEG